MKLSIIIPVFNEEKTILELLKKVDSVKLSFDKEIIIVDDGSTDDTISNIKNQISKMRNAKIIQHKINLGKGAAVKTGIENSSGDYIIIQDADLEYNPNDIPKLLDPIIKKKAQVVFGTRLKRWPNLTRDERTFRFLIHYLGNKLLSLVTSVLYSHWITDMETGYKVFPKEVCKNLNLKSRSFDFEPEITSKLLKMKYKILEVPISTNPRGYKEGKKLNTVRDGIVAVWSLFKYRFIN